VAHQGRLKGLVTVKDVLRHEAIHERSTTAQAGTESPRPRPRLGEHMRRDSTGSNGSNGSWTGWQESWASVEEGDDGRRNGQGLEIALEEAYGWISVRGNRVYHWVDNGLGRLGLKKPPVVEGGQREAFEYELSDTLRPA